MNTHTSALQDRDMAAACATATLSRPTFMEHRWGRRRPCQARVAVTAAGGIAGIGRLRNVSMSGAFIESTLPLAPFAQLVIAVLRDDGSHYGEHTATVVRRAGDGVGIEWDDNIEKPICAALGCGADCAFAREHA